MAKLGLDVSQVKSPFDPVPEANYTLKVESAELKKSKAGNPMIELIYGVVGSEKLGNRKLYNWAVLDQQSGKYLVHQHCMIAGDDPSDPDPETWINSEFEAEVTVEEGDRGPQNRVTPLVDIASILNQLAEQPTGI